MLIKYTHVCNVFHSVVRFGFKIPVLGINFVKLITFITAVKFGYVEHWAQYLI